MTFDKRRIPLLHGRFVEIDGVSDDPPVILEAWAHIGPAKAAQKNKVMTDLVKLTLARSALEAQGKTNIRLILLFADEAAARHVRGRSWMAAAIAHHGAEVYVVELSDLTRARVEAAQARQFR